MINYHTPDWRRDAARVYERRVRRRLFWRNVWIFIKALGIGVAVTLAVYTVWGR